MKKNKKGHKNMEKSPEQCFIDALKQKSETSNTSKNQQKWDKRFLNLANEVASWTSCMRRHVGSVIVKDKRIIATGYNGASAGITSCVDRGYCLRDKLGIKSGTMQEICFATHAEQNALVQAAKLGASVDGGTIYVTHQPCIICTKLIINSGIKRVVYAHNYPNECSVELLKMAGVEICQIPYENEEK